MKGLIKQILKENTEEEKIKNYFSKKWKEQQAAGKTPTFNPRDIRRLGLGKYEKIIYNLYSDTFGVDKYKAIKNYLLNNRFTQKEIVQLPEYVDNAKIEIGFDKVSFEKDEWSELEMITTFTVFSGSFTTDEGTVEFATGNIPFDDFAEYFEFRSVIEDCVVDFLNDVLGSFNIGVDYVKADW